MGTRRLGPGLRWRARRVVRTMHTAAIGALAHWCAKRVQTVETLVLVTGYPRSGSTLLGGLLNAHPEMLIAHEADLLSHLSPKTTPAQVLSRLLVADWAVRLWTSYGLWGYSYHVENQWQGSYARLRVIGDKKAYGNTRNLSARPELLDLLRDAMGWQVRNLFVYRNPYDMVATHRLNVLRDAGGRGGSRMGWEPRGNPGAGPSGAAAAKKPASLRRNVSLSEFAPKPGEEPPMTSESVAHILELSERLVGVTPLFSQDETLAVRHEDFVASPKDRLRDICAFLEVGCSEDYLDSCAAVVFPQPHRTRTKVRWSHSHVQEIAGAIGKYPWFEGYSFCDE